MIDRVPAEWVAFEALNNRVLVKVRGRDVELPRIDFDSISAKLEMV